MFVENTIKIVFSENHSFSKTQLVNPLFQPYQKHLFQKKRRHFWFWAISDETTIFIVFSGLHCFGPKKYLAKTDSVHENECFSSLPDTNGVSQCFFAKNPVFDFSHFWMTT